MPWSTPCSSASRRGGWGGRRGAQATAAGASQGICTRTALSGPGNAAGRFSALRFAGKAQAAQINVNRALADLQQVKGQRVQQPVLDQPVDQGMQGLGSY